VKIINLKVEMSLLRRKVGSIIHEILILARKNSFFEELYKYKYRERSISLGEENPDKTFYIIRRVSKVEGICSVLNSVLGHLAYAEKKGYIPVVDMHTYYNGLWQPIERRRRENAWEYYFKQPAGYSLTDVMKSKNIILSNGINAPSLPMHDSIYKKKKEIEMWNKVYLENIHLKPKIEENMNKHWIALNPKNEKIMGVCLRMGILYGFSKKSRFYNGYAKQPSLEKMIEKTEGFMKKWNCSKIFLMIDDAESAIKFKEYFGEKLILLKRNRTKYFKNGQPLNKIYKEFPLVGKMIWKDNVDYIKEFYFLSRCNCILTAKTSGAASAFIMNGNAYENEIIV